MVAAQGFRGVTYWIGAGRVDVSTKLTALLHPDSTVNGSSTGAAHGFSTKGYVVNAPQSLLGRRMHPTVDNLQPTIYLAVTIAVTITITPFL